MNERRISRLQEQLKARIAEVLLREVRDPKLGLVTITRVELDREFTLCKAYWSVIGDKEKKRSMEALQRARAFVQREVGSTLHTRTVPRLEFVFDESIAGAIRIQGILNEIKQERESRQPPAPAEPTDPADGGGTPPTNDQR